MSQSVWEVSVAAEAVYSKLIHDTLELDYFHILQLLCVYACVYYLVLDVNEMHR